MSLLSQAHPTSDSGLTISLHPLVLLTISDYITRHTLRHQPRPIVGALLGQQHGRSITLEHAFECQTIEEQSPFATGEAAQGSGRQIQLHEAWFKDRLQQYKDVHKAPALELVGWFTTAAVTGPEAAQVPIHQQILQSYNETAVLLAFHPMSVLEGTRVGGKLPLTIYESVYESAEGGMAAGPGAMDVDDENGKGGVAAAVEHGLDLRFRELPYSVETGEAEMIGIDSVARGGGNATAADVGDLKPLGNEAMNGKAADTRGAKESKSVDESLSAEDEELMASLTARVNAVKMLHTRISLLTSYLKSLPHSYLTSTSASTSTSTPPSQNQQQTQSSTSPSEATTTTSTNELNHPLLRSISALLSRLPLLQPSSYTPTTSYLTPQVTPPTPTTNIRREIDNNETHAQTTDVELIALLGALGRSVRDAQELGRKFSVVDNARVAAVKRNALPVPGSGGGGGMGSSGRGGEGDLMMGLGDLGSRYADYAERDRDGGGRGGGGGWGNGFAG